MRIHKTVTASTEYKWLERRKHQAAGLAYDMWASGYDVKTAAEEAADIVNDSDVEAPEVNWYDVLYLLKTEHDVPIEASVSIRASISGSDQYAAELAYDSWKRGRSVAEAVQEAVSTVNEANAFSEYEDEDFYEEEADYATVKKLLLHYIDVNTAE